MAEFRYALRSLAKSPGFAASSAALIAIGIAAASIIFSLFDAVLLRPLPVRRPEQLVRLVQKTPQLGTRSDFVREVYETIRDHSTKITVFGYRDWLAVMDEPAPAERIRVHLVTPEFFSTLGAQAMLGRTLDAADERESPGMPPAVLSYGFWQRRFQRDRRVIGRQLKLHGRSFAIVGVMPREFNGLTADTTPEVRVPLRAFALLSLDTNDRPAYTSLELAGRLKPGATVAEAEAECRGLWRAAMEGWYARQPDLAAAGAADREWTRPLVLDPLEHGISILRDRYGLALRLLLGCVGLLLLIVCSNVAGLLLARAAAKREEIAIRLAMGATRARLARQALVESALLAAMGSAGGWLLAWIAAPLLLWALPPIRDVGTTPLALSLDIAPDWRVMALAASASLATALLCGAAPAFAAGRASLDAILRGARSRSGWRGRRMLVVAQAALCTLLLGCAALLVRTFDRLSSLDPGFDSSHVVTFTADPALSGYTDEQARVLRLALVDRVRQIPGVDAVATASRPLMRGSGVKMTVAPEGQTPSRNDFLNTSVNGISPNYFDTLRIPIVAGRALVESDRQIKPQRVVVNRAFARRFFPTVDPVGRRFGSAGSAFQIVGVSADAKYRSLREPMTPTFYTLDVDSFFVLHVRTRMRPESVEQSVRRALAALDPALPFVEVHTMTEEVESSAAPEWLTATLASCFGLIAALLAAVGIYGLLAYAVAQRRREIGIRMALGAKPGEIGRLVGGEALAIAAVGAAIGLAAAGPAASWMRALLFDVPPSDPRSLAAAGAFVLALSLAAAFVPAARAARIEPASALRDDN